MHRRADVHPLPSVSKDSSSIGIDPRARVVVATAVLLTVVASTRPWLPLVVAVVCLGDLMIRRAAFWGTLGRLAAPLSVALLVAVVRVFSSGTTEWFVWDLGPWQLTATREGLAAGLLIGSRVLGGVAVMLRLSGTLTFEELVAALKWFRFPRTWLEISLLMYHYVFQFFEQGTEVVSAQKIRLGYAGICNGLQSLGGLAGIVLLRSMEQAERTYQAMVARGGDGLIPLPTLPPATRKMWSYAALRATGIAGVFLLAERWL